MRLRELGLVAFGPFSGQRLDFSGGAPGGLHVVYGRNEAGKSTALRAVSGLLFGIPERTQDAHLHPAPEVRVSGVLESDDGARLAVIRRKKRKDSLRDLHDAPLDEAELQRLLGGVTRETFQHLFGLDHQALKLGGEALLAGKGDVGESLYDAGLGGQGIHSVLTSLRRECEQLFKARGQNPKLNAALDAYRDSSRKQRDALLLPNVYFEQQQRLQEKCAERQRLEQERRDLYRERDRKRRIARVLKPAGELGEVRRERERLGAAPLLPEKVEERRQAALEAAREARREVENRKRVISGLEERLAKLPLASPLGAIDQRTTQRLAERLAQVRQLDTELPSLRAAIAAAEEECVAMLRRLGAGFSLASAEALRLSMAEEQRIRELERERALIGERLEAARRQALGAGRALEQKRRELAALPAEQDLTPLERALAFAGPHAELEQRVEQLRAALLELERELSGARARLGLDARGDGDVLGLPVPEPETVQRFADALRDSERAERAATDELANRRQRAHDLERHLHSIEQVGQLPTGEDLQRARSARDQLWERLKGALVARSSPTTESAPELSELFELRVRAADELADALRREAARVSDRAQARAELAQEQAALREAAASREQLAARAQELEQAWREAWQPAGITPLPPAEMRAWLLKFESFRAGIAERQRRERELSDASARLAELTRALAEVLGDEQTESLAALLRAAKRRSQAEAERASERKALVRACLELELREQEARAEEARRLSEQEAWRSEWANATASLLPALGAAPGQVLAALDHLRELFRKLDELPEKRSRLTKLEALQTAFVTQVRELGAENAPELAALPAERAAEELLRGAHDAREAAQKREHLSQELAEQRRELDAYVRQHEAAAAELAELLTLARVDSVEALLALERRAEEARRLDEQITKLEQQIREQGEGLALEALLEEARGVDRATLVGEIEELESRFDEADTTLHDLVGEIKQLEAGLRHYQAQENAAEAAQYSENLASEVRALAERYVRLRLATVVLEREIARYRDRHQGPVLSRAQALFPRLTLGKYRALRVGLEEQMIYCVRDDGAEVEVGGLSEGAQYQLFFALRLATIERYLAGNPALPLVLDDVLLHFDDDRARAAFAVLGELAERIQILFFTHHARHVELARQAVTDSRLFVHELGPAPRESGVERVGGVTNA